MSYWRSDRYELRLLTEAAFSEARVVADWNTATRLRCTKADPSGLKYSTIDDAAAVIRPYDRRGVIPTVKSESRFSFSTYLTGKGGGTPVLRTLLEAAMGGRSTATGTTVDVTNASTTVIKVANASGINVGDIVRIGVAGDGRGGGEARVVAAVDTVAVPDTITLGMAVAVAPAGADVIGIGDTYYIDGGNLSDLADAGHQSLALLMLGGGEDRYQMRGCSLGFKLSELGPGKVPLIDFEAMVNTWELLGSSPAAITDPASDGEIVVRNCNVFVQDVDVTARQAFHVADISVEPGASWAGQPSPAGSEAIMGWRCQDFQPKLTLRPYFDADWNAAFETPTRKHILVQLGSVAGKVVVIYASTAEIEATPGRGDAAGVATSEVAFRCREAASGSTDLVLSSLKIALL